MLYHCTRQLNNSGHTRGITYLTHVTGNFQSPNAVVSNAVPLVPGQIQCILKCRTCTRSVIVSRDIAVDPENTVDVEVSVVKRAGNLLSSSVRMLLCSWRCTFEG